MHLKVVFMIVRLTLVQNKTPFLGHWVYIILNINIKTSIYFLTIRHFISKWRITPSRMKAIKEYSRMKMNECCLERIEHACRIIYWTLTLISGFFFLSGRAGGMIVDPLRAGFPRSGFDPSSGIPGVLPPGAVPPGARFDPFGPVGRRRPG